MLEEIEFHRLAKLRLEVDDPEDLYVLSSQRFDLILSQCSYYLQRYIWPSLPLRQNIRSYHHEDGEAPSIGRSYQVQHNNLGRSSHARGDAFLCGNYMACLNCYL